MLQHSLMFPLGLVFRLSQGNTQNLFRLALTHSIFCSWGMLSGIVIRSLLIVNVSIQGIFLQNFRFEFYQSLRFVF